MEPDNTTVAGLSRSTVRQSVAYALLQLASNHSLAPDARDEIAQLLGIESDRYVAGMLAEVVALDSPDASVIRTLAARRFSAG